MKIYESAVRKPISTILLFVGVMVFGLFSLMNLAVDQYPEIEIPQISVITMYPGANAADIETNITRVLEDNLNTVSNLKKLTSKSQDNVSMITVEFEYGSDLNEGANEIRDVVSRVQSMLPDDIDYPTIFKFSTSMIPVMMIAVTAEESYPAPIQLEQLKVYHILAPSSTTFYMQGRKTFYHLTILSVLLQISLEKNSIPFVTFFGTNRKIKEVKRKKAKNFMTNFGIFSLAFCFLSTFFHVFSLSFIYIIFFGLLLLQRVIHIIHRLFHTGKNLVGKRFSTLCTGFSTGRKRSFTPEQKGEYNLHNVKM